MIDGFLPEGWKVGDVHKVRLPTYINVSKKTSKALNLNVYRNLHHHHLNKQKQNFHDEVKPLLRDIPRAEKIWIHYTIFASRNGRLDTMNVGSIVDKYFSDTMVESKKIMDDHFGHVVLVSFSFGGVRPMDGHAIAKIHILEQEEEEKPMRLILDQEDIQTALETFVETQGFAGANGVELSIEDGEIVAEVTMGEAKAPAKTTTKPKNRGGRPRGSKNKAKEETPDASTDTETGGDGTDSGGGDVSATDTPESAKDNAKATPETETSKEESTDKGNLFGDEENPSSDSTATSETSDTPEEKTSVVKTRKSSIFDVD